MRTYYRLILATLFLFGLILGIAGSISPAAASSPFVHVVRWGDTLFSIANRYGATMNAIMATNGMRNPNFIYIGQRLAIPTGTAPIPTPGTYVVQAGDTLFSISNRHGTTVAALMQANGLYNYWIYIGQTLRIPGQPVPLPPPPQPVPVPPPGVYHIVRPGEWLSLIAARYGSSVYAIQIANNLANPSLLWVGQRLFIPGGVAPINPPPVYNPLPPIYVPPVKPPVVILPPPASSSASSVPVVVLPPPASSSASSVPVIVLPPASSSASSAVPNPLSGTWEAVLLVNSTGTGPCSLGAFVQNRTDWPVVVATTDGSWISEPKLTGAKPERGPYYVEFAHACTGVWRVIPLGLNIYADVELKGGHAEIEFRQRP